MKRICVYCGSTENVASDFHQLATEMGQAIAKNGLELVYGGGHSGLMGRVADAVLESGGQVTGVIPVFMKELEWAHQNLTRLIETETMAERKAHFMQLSDAFVVLPGGVGTFEELFETLSLKKLGQAHGPVVIVNHDGYYDGLLHFKDSVIQQGFMTTDHKELWNVTSTVNETFDLLLQ